MVKKECSCVSCAPVNPLFKKQSDHKFTVTLPYWEWLSTLGACLMCGAITFFHGAKYFAIGEALRFQGAPETAVSEAMGGGVLAIMFGMSAILLIGNLAGRAIKK